MYLCNLLSCEEIAAHICRLVSHDEVSAVSNQIATNMYYLDRQGHSPVASPLRIKHLRYRRAQKRSYNTTSAHHPASSSPTVLKLGGITGIPLFNARTIGSLANSASTSSCESTLLFTRAYAMRLGLSTTSANFCRRASDHEERSWSASDALPERMCVRTGARASTSAIPEARPSPA